MDGKGNAKAAIFNVDKGGAPIECHFNPAEYTFSKQNSWSIANTPATNLPEFEFGGGQPATLQMQLLFDTQREQRDVRKVYTDRVWELMLIDESLKDPRSQKSRPPMVRFQWGTTWSFDAVISAIAQRFTLFLPDGTPVRAMLDVSFQQIKDAKLFPRQNPTSGGEGGERVLTVREGDTLRLLAHREYGSVALWPLIAEANNIADPRRLEPGTRLRIPPRSTPTARLDKRK
jgi:nucleoid-associated protein YgaU